MPTLILHHYGFLTADTAAWLVENELLLGKPFKVFDTVHINSQKVKITFVQQTENTVLTELIEPADDNLHLKKMISKGITVYHTGYTVTKNEFDNTLKSFEEKGAHSLPVFNQKLLKTNAVFFWLRGIWG